MEPNGKERQGKAGDLLAPSSREQTVTGQEWWQEREELTPHCFVCRRGERWFSARLLFLQSGTTAVLPILRVTLPSSVRTLWKPLHRHAEVCLQGESKSCQVGETDVTGILET